MFKKKDDDYAAINGNKNQTGLNDSDGDDYDLSD